MRKKKQIISTRLKKEIMIKAMKSTLCNVSLSVKYAQISRDTHYRWLKEDENYDFEIFCIKQELMDLAMSKLFQKIAEGHTKSIIYYLTTYGQHRGYIL